MTQDRKVAVVTGASRGIGAAMAERLARDGFAVVINYAGNKELAEKLADSIGKNGGKAIAVQADVAKPADVARLFAETKKAFGGVDVIVNNAGVMALAKIAEMDDETFDRHIDINFRGAFNVLREGSKHISDHGRIINVSTSALALRLPGYGVYVATKAAVEALTAVLANEMRGRHITVNAVAPGPTETELFMNGKTPEMVERLTKAPPLERLAQPEDISNVVSFLAGPDGAWVNGQILRANGGIA